MDFYNLKYATPDIEIKYQKYKRIRNIFIALIPLGFCMFGGGMPLSMITERYYLLFIPIVGFLMIPTSIIIMAFFSSKAATLKNIINLLYIVRSQDKTFFFQFAGNNPSAEFQAGNFIKKSVENGLLEGYTVYDGIAAVKTSAGFSESEIKNEYALLKFGKINVDSENEGYSEAGSLSDYAAATYDKKSAETKECYYCHAVVPKDAVYCCKCGTRLG